MQNKFDGEKFKSLLDESYDWPAEYAFKFVVPSAKTGELKNILKGFSFSEKASKKGNYISLTAKKVLNSSDEVIETYKKAAVVEGILSL